MRFLLLFSFLIPFVTFSQDKNELEAIIKVVVNDYEKDSIKIFHRFYNNRLIEELEFFKSQKDDSIYSYYDNKKDALSIDKLEKLTSNQFDDSVTVKIEGFKFNYFNNHKEIRRKNNKRLNTYHKSNYVRSKKLPLAYISFPIISEDRIFAIVFGKYVSGSLSGSGGLFILRKTNGKWMIKEYKMKFII